MVLRAEDRPGIRERWRVGEPYADRPGRTVRVRPRRTEPAGIAERVRGASEHLDVAVLRWRDAPVHTRVTHVRHPLLVGAGR